jgi:hypothetical protein
MDLQFPHHENEIAQSEGASGGPSCVWMHNGFLNVDDEKMSKSLGNFFTIADVLRSASTARRCACSCCARTTAARSTSATRCSTMRAARCAAVHGARRGAGRGGAVDWAEPAGRRLPRGDGRRLQHAGGVAVLFELAGEAQPQPRRRPPSAAEALGGVLGLLQQDAARFLQGGAGSTRPPSQADRRARRGQEGARLRRGRPHPRRAGRAGHRAEGFGRRARPGCGPAALPMPRVPAPPPPEAVAPCCGPPAGARRLLGRRLPHLARRDRVMKKLIPRFGAARLQSRGDAFTTLARSIVGQQISVKAAQSVWERFVARRWRRVARCTGGVQAHAGAALREAGLSARKAEYLLDLARHFASGRSCTSRNGSRWTTRPSSPSWWPSAASAAGRPRCS